MADGHTNATAAATPAAVADASAPEPMETAPGAAPLPGRKLPNLPKRLMESRAAMANAVGAVEVEPDTSAAAYHLKPILDRLAEVERGLPPFPWTMGAPMIPWGMIEAEVLDPRQRDSVADIAERYGVNKHSAYAIGRQRRWRERHDIIQNIEARLTASRTMIVLGGKVSQRQKELADEDETKRTLKLIDRSIAVYEAQLESGQVKLTSRDFNDLIRLGKYLCGYADEIQERRLAVTPEVVRQAARRVAHALEDDPALSGIVDADFAVVGSGEDDPNVPRALDTGDGPRPVAPAAAPAAASPEAPKARRRRGKGAVPVRDPEAIAIDDADPLTGTGP